MAATPTLFRCPVCGQTVTVHITPVADPTCTHRGTRHDRHRPRTMTPEGETES